MVTGLSRVAAGVAVGLVALLAGPATVNSSDQRWRDPSLPPDVRARAVLQAMTFDEKIALVHTRYGLAFGKNRPKPDGAIGSAAFAPGVPRLGIPAQQESDAGLGVANPGGEKALDDVTPLPCGLAIGATFDPALARAGGAMIGAEARAKGFDILLAGGANLTRDPRNGRNFEYVGEDPLLTGRMAGATIAGIQSQGVISTVKHFAFNDQETGRVVFSADIDDAAARESDLFAFEVALETGRPGAVMTSYNRFDGVYASENSKLVSTVLKGDWRYQGWVMSDWGAVHSLAAAAAGLDQESGQEFDTTPFFDDPLKAAIRQGRIPEARLDDMVVRVLRSNFAAGVVDHPPRPGAPVDAAVDARVAETIAQNGIVLLKNKGDVLPLATDLRRIVVIGAHSDRGVLSGGGSSQVTPVGAFSLIKEQPRGVTSGLKFYDPSAPLAAIRRRAPKARVDFVAGNDHAAAAASARGADAVVVFAEQWDAESHDEPNLSLPSEQDQLIADVASANPRTIVVLETGNPVKMPWLPAVAAVLEAWYSGARGGDAIADVLFGAVEPSGRLPMTFPRDESQLPRPTLHDPKTTQANPGGDVSKGAFDVDYDIEGADVGYKWYLRKGFDPLFPFGFGLGYTRFAHDGLAVAAQGDRIVATVDVRNVGSRPGTDTPQLYVDSPAHRFTRRLAGWARVTLEPGEHRRVSMTVDPRLLARFDETARRWQIAPDRYLVSIRPDALADGPTQAVAVPAATLPP